MAEKPSPCMGDPVGEMQGLLKLLWEIVALENVMPKAFASPSRRESLTTLYVTMGCACMPAYQSIVIQSYRGRLFSVAVGLFMVNTLILSP